MSSFWNSEQKVITRMPPSPTGYVHVGNVRTLLFNYIFAQQNDGEVVFRSEDTDKERSSREYEETNINDLNWLGLSWDHFHRQSERGEVYREELEKLIAADKAFVSKEPSKQDPAKEVEVVRLRNPGKEIVFEDLIRGEITFDTTELGDFVIARSLNDALYHFTVVVDDHVMKVTHVIRGEDHISNTPRQILIQEALGFERPKYAHLPILLGADKTKLSKRHGSVSLHEYREQGFLPNAIINYLALLGWNPGTDQEIFTPEELVEQFSFSGVQKGAAIFDHEKLNWFNREHLLRLSEDQFAEYVSQWIPETYKNLSQYSDERLTKLIPIIRERVTNGKQITDSFTDGEYDFAVEAPQVSVEMLAWKKDNSFKDALPRLQKVAEILSTIPDSTDHESVKNALWHYAEEVGKGEVLWPLRVALTGRERSPDPFTVTAVIGTAEAYKRVQHACDTILQSPQ